MIQEWAVSSVSLDTVFKILPNPDLMESSHLLTRAMELDGRERELLGDVRVLDAGRLIHGLPLDRCKQGLHG